MELHGQSQSAQSTQTLEKRVTDAFPDLARLPAPVIEKMLRHAAVRHVPAGAVMFDEHAACTGFPLILQGRVRVAQQFPNGRELQLYQVEPGDSCLLTSSCLLGGTSYPARGTAETEVQWVNIAPEVFQELVATEPAFRQHVFATFGDRLASLMQLVEAIAYQKLDQRLAGLLLQQGGDTVAMTHQELADRLGSVRVIVSRLLRGFEERGWVLLGREQVRILDRAALTALARDNREN